MADAVRLESVSRIYGNCRAVDGVDLTIRPGEFFTLLGASGSGKTTTLRLIAGFELPDEGRVLIDGHDVSRVPAYKRNVHTVFQDYALFPHLTVAENVAFALVLKQHDHKETARRVSEALDLVQLGGYEARKTSQLSGGQQQRVALARAIIDRPAVLLLDEPLSALDAKIRTELREQLKRLQRETKITFVYVTHDQEESLTLSDRIAVMKQGRILQAGIPTDLYEHPADLFVAEFIGKANFVNARVQRVDGDGIIAEANGQVVEARISGSLKAGQPVRIMVRPEHTRVESAGAPGFKGEITQSQFQGPSTEYLIKSGTQLFRALEHRHRGGVPKIEGSIVSISWRRDDALAFAIASYK